MLDSTITVARSIISGLTTFFIAFVFACYILLQKEKLNIQVKKVMFAFIPRGKAEAALEVFSLTYNTFSSFFDRAMCRGSNPRIHVCGFYVCFKNTICSADRYCNSILQL